MTDTVIFAFAIVTLLLAFAGCVYLCVAAIAIGRFTRRPTVRVSTGGLPTVTLLKPLHGADAGLYENLLSFCRQDYPGALQVVFGVQDPGDAAIGVVEQLQRVLPGSDIALVVDTTQHGTNRKVSNLINMAPHIRHDVVIAADSDTRARPDYLSRVIAALQAPGAGAVTCLYHGRAIAGVWSRLFALGIDAVFLPNVLVGLHLGLAHPCFGSTIAMRRDTLDGIGGFEAVADILADDYAIGAAVRARGEAVIVPPFVVAHICDQSTFGAVWRHQLRWARTIRAIAPLSYAGSLVVYPLPWAVLATALGAIVGLLWPGLALVIAALVGRIAILDYAGRKLGFSPRCYWLVPMCELLSFAVAVASFLGRRVIWRGQAFHIGPDGTLLPEEELRNP